MQERLQKYMARCGVASRRSSEEIILEGRVKVNNNVITELGYKIDCDTDEVKVDDRIIKPEENKVYIMLNKPEGYVTTVKDEKSRSTILDLVDVEERIYPIGRLDYDSSGLLLLTNDGEIYNKIIHPRKSVDKVYMVKVKGIFTSEEMKVFRNGVDIGGYITSHSQIDIIEKYKEHCLVRVVIHEGKNRQIRRMCQALGHEVIALKRVAIGTLELGDLPKGKWRHLKKEEVQYLYNL